MSRHGKRAAGTVQISVLLDEETKASIQSLAQADDRTMSKWIARELAKLVEEYKATQAHPKSPAAKPHPPDESPSFRKAG